MLPSQVYFRPRQSPPCVLDQTAPGWLAGLAVAHSLVSPSRRKREASRSSRRASVRDGGAAREGGGLLLTAVIAGGGRGDGVPLRVRCLRRRRGRGGRPRGHRRPPGPPPLPLPSPPRWGILRGRAALASATSRSNLTDELWLLCCREECGCACGGGAREGSIGGGGLRFQGQALALIQEWLKSDVIVPVLAICLWGLDHSVVVYGFGGSKLHVCHLICYFFFLLGDLICCLRNEKWHANFLGLEFLHYAITIFEQIRQTIHHCLVGTWSRFLYDSCSAFLNVTVLDWERKAKLSTLPRYHQLNKTLWGLLYQRMSNKFSIYTPVIINFYSLEPTTWHDSSFPGCFCWRLWDVSVSYSRSKCGITDSCPLVL